MQYLFESAICLACFYAFYWLVSDRTKQVLETIDPEGVVFMKCDVHFRDGEPGPTYWLCDVLRILDAVDEDASKVGINYDQKTGQKGYGIIGAKLVFKEEVVGPAHIFRVQPTTGRVR